MDTAYHVRTTVGLDGTITIKHVPLRAEDQVEVFVLSGEPKSKNGDHYPLRGQPIRYDHPFEGIAQEDWDVLR